MGKLFWIIIGVLGASLIGLIINHDKGTLLGIENNQFASFVVISMWGVLIASAAFGRGRALGETLKQLAIWLAIILVLMAGYVFRYELQDIGARLTGGLIPGSPISRIGLSGGHEVTLIRSPNGHFEADIRIDGTTVRFLIDTGASTIVLSAADARRVGIDLATLNYSVLTQTANGRGRAARANIASLRIGSIERQKLQVLIAAPGRLGQSLLGQDFLESLSSYEKRGDRLTLRD